MTTILFSLLTLLVGLIAGFVIGAETGQNAAYKAMRPDLDTTSPAEYRRRMNRPWT